MKTLCSVLCGLILAAGSASVHAADFGIRVAAGPDRVLCIRFPGSNPQPELVRFADRASPFAPPAGGDPSDDPYRWQAGVPAHHRMMYRELYRGVDLVCYSAGRRLRYELVVNAWADPGVIRVACGDAVAEFAGYQVANGMRIAVPVSPSRGRDGDGCGLVIGRYDRALDLVIPLAPADEPRAEDVAALR
jgi:hypothetical protein